MFICSCVLLYRHDCFTGKCTTHKIHTKLHLELEWRSFHLLVSEDILQKVCLLNCSLICWICWCIIETSSVAFGNLRKMFGSARKMFGKVRQAFGTILENLRKSSESGRRSSESRQKLRHQHVYTIKKTLNVCSEI